MNHSLDNCTTFLKKDLKERFLEIKGICFPRLKSGHQKAVCQHNGTCANCHITHPTIQHIDSRQWNNLKNEGPKQEGLSRPYEHTRAGEYNSQALRMFLKLSMLKGKVQTYICSGQLKLVDSFVSELVYVISMETIIISLSPFIYYT